jgi:UV DNA damage endonuclease
MTTNSEESQNFRPRLGLVCITHNDAVRYRTITRKRLLQFDAETQRETLRELYRENLARLNRAIDFCAANDITLYRLTSAFFPFADDEAGERVLDEISEEVALTGDRINASDLRLVLHPDQFVVLNSDSPQVIENSIKILITHARIFDMLRQPQSAWAVMNIHGGKGDRAGRLIETIENLPKNVRSRLALENDEYSYGAQEILEICRLSGVPFVFDAHHHVCREKLSDYNDRSVVEMFYAARETWPRPDWQLVHISNGREHFNDRSHSELVAVMPDVFREAPFIEIEAKHKELAIAKLRAEWLNATSIV